MYCKLHELHLALLIVERYINKGKWQRLVVLHSS